MEQKISGLAFVNQNIAALTYGIDMEIETANTFIEFINGKHKDIKLSDFGLCVEESTLLYGLIFMACIDSGVQ